MLNELRKVRDEVELQLHLGSAEARDHWNELESKFQRLQTEAKEATSDAAVKAELEWRKAIKSLKEGYGELKNQLHN